LAVGVRGRVHSGAWRVSASHTRRASEGGIGAWSLPAGGLAPFFNAAAKSAASAAANGRPQRKEIRAGGTLSLKCISDMLAALGGDLR
jgi:hypothetical protein